ncbi:MAG: VOC family protein [Bacteroidetes bacterium]|nr:VOC family protein [Bacteroidota bacterium]
MKILSLTLQTNQLEKTKEFYSQCLGFQCVDAGKDSFSLNIHSSILTFERVESSECTTYHFAFNIPHNQIQEAFTWLSSRVELIENENRRKVIDFKDWKAQAMYFYDTNQNIVEFIGREGLQNSSQGEFDTDSILCINEVGVVTEQPLEWAKELMAKTKVTYFDKGPVREDFVAIGDDDGLFVVSTPARNWYPTSQKAQKCKVGTTVLVGNTMYKIEINGGKLRLMDE